MAVLEIVLAVILTLLGFAILAILLTRWTRRKQNEIDISRYSSEQSAGLLDYEDDRGFWNLYSTESDISYDNREGYNRNYMTSTSSLGDTNDLKATPELLPGTVGPITGTIGPIMQFTAPIPGATGPIKLSQKTIVQTPGPIVQYTGSSAETSETTYGPAPQALTCPPSMVRGLPLAPIMISQRTSTRPEKSKVRQEPPTHVAVPIITPVPIVIGPVTAVNSSGKVTLSPMEEKSEPRRYISQQPTVTSKPVGTASGQTVVTSKPVRTVSTQTVTTKESPMSRTILPTAPVSTIRFAEPIAKTSPPLTKATPPVTTKATPSVTKKNPKFHAGSREESGSVDIRRKGDWRRAASAPSSNLRKCSKTEAKSGTGETRKTTPKQDIYLRIQVVPPQNSQSGPKYQHKRALSGPEENYGKGQIQKPGVKVEKLPEKTLSKEGKRVKDDKRKGIGEVMDKENKTEKGQSKKGDSIKDEGETGEPRVNVKKGDEDADNKDKKGDEDRKDQDKKEDEDSNKNKDKKEDEDKTKDKDMKGDEDKIKVKDIKEDEEKTEDKGMKGDEEKTENKDMKGDEDKIKVKDIKEDEEKTEDKGMKGDEEKTENKDMKGDEEKTEDKGMKGDEEKTENKDMKGNEEKTEAKGMKGDEEKTEDKGMKGEEDKIKDKNIKRDEDKKSKNIKGDSMKKRDKIKMSKEDKDINQRKSSRQKKDSKKSH